MRLALSQVQILFIMLGLILFGIGYNVANQNFNFQLMRETSDRIWNITTEMHEIDQKNDKQQDQFLTRIINTTKSTDNAIQLQELMIKNITQTNLNNTYKNKANIAKLLATEQEEVAKLDKLLNTTR